MIEPSVLPAQQRRGVRVKKYRPDIDGLRAVAVVSVVLFHLSYLRGGFVGVDIFFVISGCLITSILVTELEEGTFSLGGFYERRIRRIAPALFVIFTASIFLGYKYLLPGEFTQFANSLLAALLSVSNLFFWHQSGYFDALSSSKPLLHTWSLAVEEQFYLLFPLLLAFLYRVARKQLTAILLGIIAISLTLGVVLTHTSPDFAFYWPITRAWELLIGSLLVLVDLPLLRHAMVRNAASAIGLAVLIFVLLRYSSSTPFPGIAALLPCLGAALIIASGTQGPTFVNRALSLKPVVFTGLISYSFYLWHWPIIVFGAHGMPLTEGLPHRFGKPIIFAASFAAGVLSWRFVERPFRRARPGSLRRHVFVTAGVAAAFVAVVAVGIALTGGLPNRFSLQAQTIAAYPERTASVTQTQWRVGRCFISSASTYKDFDPEVCLKRDAKRENDLLMGDSHAAQLYHGLSQAFPEKNFMQATASGCKPTLQPGFNEVTECRKIVDYIFRSYLTSHPKDHVLLSGRWSPGDLDRVAETVAYLKSIGVVPIVIGPMVEYDSALPTLLAMSLRNHDPEVASRHRVASLGQLDETMSRLAADHWHARYISYYPYLCGPKDCMTLLPGDIPMLEDADHLSSPGSEYVAQRWRDAGVLSPQVSAHP